MAVSGIPTVRVEPKEPANSIVTDQPIVLRLKVFRTGKERKLCGLTKRPNIAIASSSRRIGPAILRDPRCVSVALRQSNDSSSESPRAIDRSSARPRGRSAVVARPDVANIGSARFRPSHSARDGSRCWAGSPRAQISAVESADWNQPVGTLAMELPQSARRARQADGAQRKSGGAKRARREETGNSVSPNRFALPRYRGTGTSRTRDVDAFGASVFTSAFGSSVYGLIGGKRHGL